MNCNSWQAAGSGAHDSSTQDNQPDPSDWHELVQQPQHNVRTIRVHNVLTDGRLPCHPLEVQGDLGERPDRHSHLLD